MPKLFAAMPLVYSFTKIPERKFRIVDLYELVAKKYNGGFWIYY